MPCTLSSDAVKQTGCLGLKMTSLGITTMFESFQFAFLEFCHLSDEHTESGKTLSDKLINKCTKMQLPQLTYYCADNAASQMTN